MPFFILIVLDKRTTIKNVASTVAILKDNQISYKIIHTRFVNISHARNWGLNYGNAKYHLFLDDDIMLSPDFFDELFKLKIYSTTLCIPQFLEYIDANELYDKTKTWETLDKELIRVDPYYKNVSEVLDNKAYNSIKWVACIGRCIILVTPNADKTISMFDEDFRGWGVEDIEFAYRNYKQGVKLIKIPASCLHLCHRIAVSHIADLSKNLLRFEEKYSDEFDPIAYRLFTFGKLSLSSWIKINQILKEQ